MKQTFLLLLLSAFSLINYAISDDTSWSVSGNVNGESGKPLSGATIIISETFLGAFSNIDGSFDIKAVKQGTYNLTVSYIGYQTYSAEIVVESDLYLDINLEVSTIVSDEVIVKGIRASAGTPVAHTEMRSEEIKRSNIGQDLPYLLSLQPSVIETSESGTGIGYTGLRIRGSDASRINVTVDGIPLNDSESQQVFWVNMPDLAASVSDIQIQRGVGTSTNGAGAFGGSINMILENPSDDPYAEVSTTAGSFGTMKASAKLGTGYLKDNFKLDMRFSGITSQGYIDRSRSDHRSLFISGLYRFKSSILKANFIYGEEVTGISWWGVPADSLATNRTYNPAGEYYDNFGTLQYYNGQTDNYTQTHAHLVYNWQISDNLFLKSAGHFTRGAGYYEQYKESQKLADYNLPNWIIHGLIEDVILDESALIRRKWLFNQYYGAVFNLNYVGSRLEASLGGALNRYVGDHFGRIVWMRFAGNTEIDFEWYRNGGRKDEFSIYGKVNYRLTDAVTLYGDLQYRNIDYFVNGPDDDLSYIYIYDQFNFFNPKAGVFAKINSHQDIYLSFAIANREPTRADYKDAAAVGEDIPIEETLYDFEAGYEVNYSQFSFGLNIYYMYYSDQLVPTGKLSNVGYPLMTNVDRSFRAGLELMGGFKYSSFLEWSGGITLSRNRIKDFTEYAINENTITGSFEEITIDHADVDIAYSPSYIASSKLSFHPFNDFDVHFISKYVGEQYFDNTESDSRMIDPYLVNNLRFDYSFDLKGLNNIELQLLVNNLFNNQYVSNAYGGNGYVDMLEYTWAYYFPQAGTNFLLRLTLNF